MKLLNKIIDFVVVAMVFVLIAALCFAKLETKGANETAALLAHQVDSINNIRLTLAADLAQKEKEIELQVIVNDSLRILDQKNKAKYNRLLARHSALLDSIKNIPPDTAFKALNEVYDFGDTLPRPYPFNAPQVKSMYATFISDLQQKEQNSLLLESYKDCGNIVDGLTKENSLLNSVVTITKKDNELLLSQSAIYKTESETNSAKYASSRKWNTVWKGVAAVLGLVAAFK